MSHFLHSIGWISCKEPFKRMLVQGMVMGKTYRVKGSGRYLKEEEIIRDGNYVLSNLVCYSELILNLTKVKL